MQQLSNVPKFQGEESSQDAEKWLETLVDCTGSFSDAGLFRLLSTKFPSGSRAREWFDNLDDSFKEKWAAFEKQFRSRWIAASTPVDGQEGAWNAFISHSLNIDKFFNYDTISYDDLDIAVAVWVEEHIRLGKATSYDDSTLIKATLPSLPPFISAYLQTHFKPPYPSFSAYCTKVCEMPVNVLEMERIRRQISSVDRTSSMDRRFDEVVELVKQVLVMKGDPAVIPGGSGDGTNVIADGQHSTSSTPSVNVPKPEFIISQAVGGQGGYIFDDQPSILDPAAVSISAIKMEIGREYLDSIQLSFRIIDGPIHGNDIYLLKDCTKPGVCKKEVFLLEENEYVNKVFLWERKNIKAIQFRTTKERLSPQFGHAIGTPIELPAPPRHKLLCFKGRCGWFIDNISAVWYPM